MMNTAHPIDDEQTTLWNGPAGRAWVEAEDLLDQMFKPFENLLVELICTGSGRWVLDIGCGTGSTTLAVARLLGPSGRCIGMDISEPMIAAARVRAERNSTPATFLRSNPQTHVFEPATFDLILSRFGVMFFDDPVQAFANLRHAATDDAELRFIAWRSAAENPFMTAAERAAAPLLPPVPARPPEAPGQFAFADPYRIDAILTASGWAGIDIQPIDVPCSLPANGLDRYLTRLGPVGRRLDDADDVTRTQVIETVRAAFDRYVYGDEVLFTASCWMVGARASETMDSRA